MSTHPAPWRAESGAVKGLTHGQWFTIALVDRARFTPAGREAHARLIAAAPDLLAALRACLDALGVADERAEGDLFGAHHNTAMDAMDSARAAIAKARGA